MIGWWWRTRSRSRHIPLFLYICTPPQKKKKKDKQGDDGSGKAAPRRRLLIPGAGHDDSFLYTLQAAGVEGHEYDEYVLIDKLEAMVGGEVSVRVW